MPLKVWNAKRRPGCCRGITSSDRGYL